MHDLASKPKAPTTRGRPFRGGNPGRPKGARNKTTVLAERLLSADVEAVARSVIEAAKAGDMITARTILDRVLPVRKGRPVTFELPDSLEPSGLAKAFSAVLKAVSQGELTPEDLSIHEGLTRTIHGVFEIRRLAKKERLRIRDVCTLTEY